MSSGIDYSKWDKMVAEMSDSESEDQSTNQPFDDYMDEVANVPEPELSELSIDKDLSRGPAKVTRLNQPSSVTIGPQGLSVVPNPVHNSSAKALPHDARNNGSNKINKMDEVKDLDEMKEFNQSIPSISVSLSSLLSKWTCNGGVHQFDYLWSQTADELVVRFLVPMATRAKNIEIKFDVESKSFWCRLRVKGTEWTLDKRFCRKLKASEEEEAALDWTLCDVPVFNWDHDTLQLTMNAILGLENGSNNSKIYMKYAQKLSECRFLTVTMEKERINNRIIEWWDAVFDGDTSIDLEQRIKDRRSDPQKMKDLWEKAHEQFRKEVANIEPQEIEVPENDEEDDGDTIDID